MKTKEAINDAIETIKYYNRMYYDTGHTEDLDKVIELLKRGEKFEMMWKLFKNKSGFRKIEHVFVEFQCTIEEIMESYEQKYFPKTDEQILILSIKGEKEEVNDKVRDIKNYFKNTMVDVKEGTKGEINDKVK